jgi:uncharacterized membrane protein YfcA
MQSSCVDFIPPSAEGWFLCSTLRRLVAKCLPMLRVILLLSKAVLRDTRLRRNMMLWLMAAALLMLFFGSWLLSDDWARKHYVLYFLYWAFCMWLTLTAVLLAVFDMLVVRATGRAMRRQIEQDIAHIDEKTKEDRR